MFCFCCCSAFFVNSGDELAILYNDITVLESHHAACTFKLTLADERANIFKGIHYYSNVRINFTVFTVI